MKTLGILPLFAAGLLVAGCTGPAVAPSTPATSSVPMTSPATSTETEPTTASETPSETELPVPTTEPSTEVSLTPPTAPPTETSVASSAWTTMDVEVKTAAEAGKLTGTTPDFQTFVASKVGTEDSSGCTSQYTIKAFNPAGFAIGDDFAPGCGGALTIWGKVDGAWGVVLATQAAVPCEELTRNLIPTQAPGLQCIDPQGAVVDY